MDINTKNIIVLSLSGAFFLTLFFWWLFARAKDSFKKADLKDINDLASSLDELVSSLNTASSDIVNKIDAKKNELDALVDKADQKIQVLKGLTIINQDRLQDTGLGNRLEDFEHKHDGIFKLYDEGLSISEISKRTNLDKGTIQLIFNLRRKV